MTTENPFDGRAYGDLVFLTRPERNFFIGRLSPSQQKKWLQDHPERWQTREDALRDLQAYSRIDVEAEPSEARSTTSGNEVRTNGETDGPLLAPGEDKPQPDKPAANTTPLTTANAEATAAAGDEIIIGERRLISERRVAAMLGYSQRQLQRWRKEQKGPASTKIGRWLFYELDTLQEWIEEKKQVMPAVRIWLTKLPRINRPTSISRGVLADPRLTRSSSPTTTRSDGDPCLQTKIVGFKDDSESSAVWTDLIEMKPRASATLTVILSIRCFGGAARRAESNEPQHRPGRSTGSCRRLVEAPGYR